MRVGEYNAGRSHDSASATELNRIVNSVFNENDVYRIDHYLGKETVQNLLVFRFANAIFEPLWNQKYVDNVQITVAESIGVGGRGKYYEEAGTTRDMVQNHMLQLVCLTAMEPPVSLVPDAIRDEKVKVLQALRPVQPADVERSTVRGQYVRGVVDGEQVIGYKEEEHVAADSRTETYVAARLHVDNWRWAGVPFYLRAAKRMPKRMTEIALEFKDVPHRLFEVGRLEANTLTLRIQPDEGISIKFDTKVPGIDSVASARELARYMLLLEQGKLVHVIPLQEITRGEVAENMVRKAFTPTEEVAIYRALQPAEKEAATSRKVSGRSAENTGETRDKLAAFVGKSGRTLEKQATRAGPAQREGAAHPAALDWAIARRAHASVAGLPHRSRAFRTGEAWRC